MNPKAETVEELQERRKNLHMGMLKLAREDLALTLQNAINAFKVPPSPLHFLPKPSASGCAPRPSYYLLCSSELIPSWKPIIIRLCRLLFEYKFDYSKFKLQP